MKFSRRFFLGGLGATAAGLTLGGKARAFRGRPRRFLFVVSGNGYDAWVTMSDAVKTRIAERRGTPIPTDGWWDGRYGASDSIDVLSGALSGAPGLRAFESAGLLDQCAMVYGLSSMVTGGGHATDHGVLSSTRSISGRPRGRTIDDLLAKMESVRGVDGERTPYEAIRVAALGRSRTTNYRVCASGPRQPLPLIASPTAAYDSIVAPFVGADGLERLAYRRRLLEFARRDAQRHVTQPANRQAMAAVAATSASLGDFSVLETLVASGLSVPAPAAPGALSTSAYKQYQMDVATFALTSCATNVSVASMGAGGWLFTYDDINGRADWGHGRYHDIIGEADMETRSDVRMSVRNDLRESWSREIDIVASAAQTLASTPEPNGSGTMLANTVIVYIPENGVGHHGRAHDFPTLLVGGSNLGLNTGGRAIIYPDFREGAENRRELYNLYKTVGLVCGAGDVDAEFPAFGDVNNRLSESLLGELID